MKSQEKNKIIEELYIKGMFSEYLPENFATYNLYCLKNKKLQTPSIKPILYTMNKNENSVNRRTISIPEASSYVNALKELKNNKNLEYILEITENNKISLSKILNENYQIRSFNQNYDAVLNSENNEKENFISNTILKLKLAKGSYSILSLDVNNFYGSFYTHNITAIGNGAEWAQKEFDKDKTKSKKYNNLLNLDIKIRGMNTNRTHGLLVGPRISFIIAEGLMATIDDKLILELRKELKYDLDFIRFVDDYEIFIKNENDISKIVNIFSKVLEKYGLVLNESKQNIKRFPYYIYEDFNNLLSIKHKTEEDILNIYSKFAKIDLLNEQKGSLFFLSSKIYSFVTNSNYNIISSILLSVLKNNVKSLPTSIKTILEISKEFNDNKLDNEIIISLKEYLNVCINNKYEYEEIWIIYCLLKLNKSEIKEYFLKNLDIYSELSLVMILNEYIKSEDIKTKIKDISNNYGWLINYELFFYGVIDEEHSYFNEKTKLLFNFQTFKRNNIYFYK